MARMTNGTVTFERSVKVADYENKKFAAQFSFILDDDDDPESVAEMYGRQIVRFVEDKLGLKSSIALPEPAKKAEVGAGLPGKTVAQHAAETAEAKPKGKPGRPSNAEKAARAAANKQAASTSEAPASEPETEGHELSSAPSEVPEITDAQLREKIQHHVAQHGDSTAVRRLVQSFFPAKEGKVWQSQELPNDRRQEFLDKMAALAAPAGDAI